MSIEGRLETIRIKKDKLVCVGMLFGISMILFPLAMFILDIAHAYSYFLILILALVIISFFILKRTLVLFEPIVVFSAYYFTIVISGVYLLITDFKNNVFIDSISYSKGIIQLFNHAILFCIIGYISVIAGYYFIRRTNPSIKIHFDPQLKTPDIVLKLTVFLFLSAGIFNFMYNIYWFAEGSLFVYLKNISIRFQEFETGGSTIGYLFAYLGMYVWYFYLLRKTRRSFLFIFFLFLTILMKASTGRVIGTIMYIISFFVIEYFVGISKKQLIKNARYIWLFTVAFFVAISLYFLRLLSGLSIGYLGIDLKSTFFNFFTFDSIFFYLVSKGNIPNLPILMKIIDSWASDIGFLYGKSLLTWTYGVLPSVIRPVDYQPSAILKNEWFPEMGGNLPPTGIGEMYANFGVLGPVIGMFLFGILCAYLYNIMLKVRSYWMLVIYGQITVGFVFIYAKGEFDNLSLWMIVPVLLTVVFIRFLTTVIYRIRS